jgi:hypothetical protein
VPIEDSSEPSDSLELEFIYGFTTDHSRQSLMYTSESELLFFAGSVAVLMEQQKRKQRYICVCERIYKYAFILIYTCVCTNRFVYIHIFIHVYKFYDKHHASILHMHMYSYRFYSHHHASISAMTASANGSLIASGIRCVLISIYACIYLYKYVCVCI